MRSDKSVARRYLATIAALAAVAALGAGVPAAARTGAAEAPTHCVAAVGGAEADGRLVLSAPECYDTVSEATEAARAVAVGIDEAAVATAPASSGAVASGTEAETSSLTLAIHYDGTGGSGSSITIVGSGCTGGYWNAIGWWKNRISSSYNGCARLKHFDFQNRAGASYTTLGSGSIDSLGWFSNMTESVSYHSS